MHVFPFFSAHRDDDEPAIDAFDSDRLSVRCDRRHCHVARGIEPGRRLPLRRQLGYEQGADYGGRCCHRLGRIRFRKEDVRQFTQDAERCLHHCGAAPQLRVRDLGTAQQIGADYAFAGIVLPDPLT